MPSLRTRSSGGGTDRESARFVLSSWTCGRALGGVARMVETVVVVERSLSDPASLVGASAEELLALKPPGWLVRPLPGGGGGFRMISPGKMPGGRGTITCCTETRGWVQLPDSPEPWLLVLNSATEHMLLVEILADWARPAHSAGAAASDIPRLADATGRLIRAGLVQIYLDPLDREELELVERDRAMREVADVRNWWRDENDQTTDPAAFILAVSITDKGIKRLASAAGPRPSRWPWRWRHPTG